MVVPVVVLIGLAVKHGRVLQEVEHLKARVAEILANCQHCQDKTGAEDQTLHGRITALGLGVAALETTAKHHGERLEKLERRVNGNHAG
jgi:hypothetical protein